MQVRSVFEPLPAQAALLDAPLTLTGCVAKYTLNQPRDSFCDTKFVIDHAFDVFLTLALSNTST